MGTGPRPALTSSELLEAMGQAVIATAPDGVVVAWNAAAERMYGWTADEAIGRNIATLTVPQLSQDMADDILTALREGVPWSGGFLVQHKEGRLFPALVTDAAVYRDGAMVGIVGVSAPLGTAMRPLLERSTDAAVAIRADAVVTYASPAVTTLFGWDDTAVLGTSIVPLIHPDDRAPLADFLGDIGSTPGAHLPLELRLRCEDGSWAWVEAALTNLLDDPVVRGVVCNLHPSIDRAARERAEERAQQLQQALDSRILIEQAKGYLAATWRVSPDDAFHRLRRYARNHDVTIRSVSRQVLDGELQLPCDG